MIKKVSVVIIFFLTLAGCNYVGSSYVECGLPKGKAVNDITESQKAPKEGLLSPGNILNIAHRGASGHAPEHTIASYETGEEMHADYIEIDLQMTKDGELIAMHDDDVSRTTDEEGSVRDFTLSEITSLNAGSWFNSENPNQAEAVFQNVYVPSLDEILNTFGSDAHYYIETKEPETSPDMVEKLMSTLDEHGLLDDDMENGQVIIQSCSPESLQEVHAIDESIPLIQLIRYKGQASITKDQLDRINRYAVGIGANYTYLSKEYVGKVRDADLLLHPYTVNEKADMKRLIEWGASGFFTNYPDRLHDVLDELDVDSNSE